MRFSGPRCVGQPCWPLPPSTRNAALRWRLKLTGKLCWIPGFKGPWQVLEVHKPLGSGTAKPTPLLHDIGLQHSPLKSWPVTAHHCRPIETCSVPLGRQNSTRCLQLQNVAPTLRLLKESKFIEPLFLVVRAVLLHCKAP